jgi:hypothetical protein
MPRITEATMLLEQARTLRALARGLDQPIIKRDVLKLAERCEELAQTAEGPTQRCSHETAAVTAAASSRRTPQPDFIEEVPQPTHRSLKELYAYWISKRGTLIAPARSAIRLEEIPALLPNIALTDVVGDPPRFRIRLFGANLAAAYGEDLAGRFLDEVDFGSVSRQTTNLFAKMVRECRPQVVRAQYTKFRDGRRIDYERIALPLSEDGKAVSMILSGCAYHTEWFNAAVCDASYHPHGH